MKSTASSNTKSREKKKELVNGVPIIRYTVCCGVLQNRECIVNEPFFHLNNR